MERFIFLLAIVSSGFLNGCTSAVPQALGFGPTQIPEFVSPGDSVIAMTEEKARYYFIVVSVSDRYISGEGIRIKNTDVRKLTLQTTEGVRKTVVIDAADSVDDKTTSLVDTRY